jgi:peptidoglycan hydrolase-like protein with peptidoglycan-binding domain
MTRARAAMAAMSLIVGLGVAVAAANPAAAADAPCTGSESYFNGRIYVVMPVASDGAFSCYMNRGNTGDDVRAMQNTLNSCYGASLTIDGSFGPKTQAALRAAESTAGMTTDLGRYSSLDAYNLRHRGWYVDSVGNVRWSCGYAPGPILQ